MVGACSPSELLAVVMGSWKVTRLLRIHVPSYLLCNYIMLGRRLLKEHEGRRAEQRKGTPRVMVRLPLTGVIRVAHGKRQNGGPKWLRTHHAYTLQACHFSVNVS